MSPVAAGERREALDAHDEHRVSAVHERAIDNLRYIRRTMESAGSFTAIPGWGQVVMGTTALIAAALAWHQTRVEWWLATWLIEAVLSLLVGAWAVGRKAQATGIPLLAGPSRRFAFCFLPPMAAAVVLTFAIYRAGATSLLPGMWLLMFGAGVSSGGVSSIGIVRIMGLSFLLLGALALFAPAALGDLFMALGFGGLLIGYGLIIAWRYGG